MRLKSVDYRNTNFWEENPNFLAFPVFRDLYNKDKSKDKKNSSNIMWSIVLMFHPDSMFFNLPLKAREEIVSNFVGVKDISSFKEEIKEFENIILTPAQRQLIQWNRIMDEKTEFMRKTPYDEKNWEMLEKMMQSNVSLYKEYERIMNYISKERDEKNLRGGAIESASEAGII